MATFPSFNPTSLFAGTYPHISRPLTITAGLNAAGVPLPRGTVLGIDGSGNAVLATSTVAPKCILAADVDTSAGAVAAPCYFTGEFADFCLNFGTGGLTPATADLAFATSGQPIFIRNVGSVA